MASRKHLRQLVILTNDHEGGWQEGGMTLVIRPVRELPLPVTARFSGRGG